MIHRILSLGTIAVDTMLYIDKMPGKDGFGHSGTEIETAKIQFLI